MAAYSGSRFADEVHVQVLIVILFCPERNKSRSYQLAMIIFWSLRSPQHLLYIPGYSSHVDNAMKFKSTDATS